MKNQFNQKGVANTIEAQAIVVFLHLFVFVVFLPLHIGLAQHRPSIKLNDLTPLMVLNSQFPEEAPLVTPDGSKMFFSSARRDKIGEIYYGYDHFEQCYRYDYDIYYSTKIGEEWSEPKRLGDYVNSDADDGVLCITPDGNALYFVSFKKDYNLDGGPFYRAEIRGDSLVNIQGLGGGLVEFWENSDYNSYSLPDKPEEEVRTKYLFGVAVSSDEQELYFATDINRKYGKVDIWVSYKIDGVWSEPINLGPNINALDAINFEPRLSFDDDILFFSSNGWGGYGGNDLFYSKRVNGKWTKPINLGGKINTPFDDLQINIPPTGDYLFTVINIPCVGLFKDIYALKISDCAEFLPNTIVLQGRVIDRFTLLPVKATIKVISKTLNETSYVSISDSYTGEFKVALHSEAEYEIVFENDSYIDYVLEIENLSKEMKHLNKEILLTPIQIAGEIKVAEVNNYNTENLDIIVKPNPFEEYLVFEFGNRYESLSASIEIFSLDGEKVFSYQCYDNKSNQIILDLKHLPNGTYLAIVKIGESKKEYKIIKM